MTEPLCYVDPRTLIQFVGIMPLGVRVIAGVNPIPHLNSMQIANVVPGRKARSLAEVWKLDPPRRPFAGKSR